MSRDPLQGRRPPAPVYVDPAARDALLALLDDGFSGLRERIAAADAAGFAWDAVTEPFVEHDARGPVAHVGVLEHRVRLAGRDVVVGGVHAVCTRSDARGRGHARAALARALRWCDERYEVVKLGTDLPAVYAPHGFRPLPTHHFEVPHQGGAGAVRPLAPTERAAFLARCDARDPVSDAFASLDPGWLVGIDLALQRRSLGELWVVDGLDAVVDWSVGPDGALDVHDVFARRLPPLDALLERAPPHHGVRLHFLPDRLAPGARPVPRPHDGVWMVRGAWPLPASAPFAVGRLAEH